MLRLLILVSLGAVISASFLPHHLLGYPRSLQSLFGTKRETADEETTKREVCNNTECVTIAKLLKESMNESVSPCDDFYEYACGKWSSGNPIPENRTDWSLWTMVSEKIENQVQSIIETKPKPSDLFAVKLAKKWYESCMDTEMIERRGAEPIISTLWRHGGWPLIMEEGEWDDQIYHWQIVDDHFARLLGFNAFHDVYYGSISYDGNDTIRIDTSHLPLGLRKLLDFDGAFNTMDSSDENNESGEGSQEAGSEERGKEQQDENEGKENDEENEENENEEDENEVTVRNRNGLIKRRNHKRFGHGNRHLNKKGTKKRTKRDAMKIMHRILHQLRKAKTQKAKSSKHHVSMVKSHTKKQNHESKKKLHGKVTKAKNTKRIGHEKKKSHSRLMKKHVHERNLKKKLNVHNNQHHEQKKINHRVHHVANKMKLANRKKMLTNDTENTDNDMDSDIETDNDEEKGETNDETKNDDEKEDTNVENNEESNDDADNDVDNKNDDVEDEENDVDNKNDDTEDEETNEDVKNDEENEENEDETSNDDDEENDDDNEDNDEEETEKDSEEEVDLEELRAEYKEFMLNVSLILSKARGIEIPQETLMKDINDLLEFSIKVGELTLKDEEPVNTTLREFQEEYDAMGSTTRNGKINWVKKVQKLFAEAGVDIEDDVEITITNPEYIKKLHTLLDNTPSRTIVNYIHWMFISTAIMAGPKELRSLAENWLVRRMHFSSRKSECIQLVDLNDIVAYEYVQQYFSEETAKTARDMIDDIQKEVEYQIKESTWMNDDTKHFILDKLVNMKNLVGYPNWYKNTTLVKQYFQGLTIGPSYYENLLNYVRHRKWRILRQIVEKRDRSIEYLDPLMLNAFFIPTENSISITAADFQSPFFAINRPWAVNFGIIGLVMGHEINHGFDDQGHLYDHGGNLMEWLSAMADAYNKRAECFVDQFNRYSIVHGENYTIENYGNQTAGENIADTMGMQAVFRAFKRRERECGKPDPALPGLEKFDNDQIFFLSFANVWCESIDRESLIRSAKYDVHSTGRLRVIGSVSNSEDFAKAFNCPVDSPMNPKRKCNIWV